MLLGFQVTVDRKLIDQAPNLKYIGLLAVAYGTVDVAYAKHKGIVVSNLAGYCTESVAEFTIAAILYHIRQLEEGRARAKNGNYSFEGMFARELKGSQFGVVGLGAIGSCVAELAASFGAEVSYWSHNKKDTAFLYKELDELLSSSDYISINVAETSETIKLLNSHNIPKIKTGAVLISTVPPPVIDTDALVARLAKKDLTFISDHPDEMSEDELMKIKEFENCILYPPIAFISEEARQMKQEMFIGNIKACLAGNPQNTVA